MEDFRPLWILFIIAIVVLVIRRSIHARNQGTSEGAAEGTARALWKSTSTPEVQAALSELDRVREELSGAGVDSRVAFDAIKPGVVELIQDAEKTTASIATDGLTPRTLVFLLIAKAARQLIPSGRFHIYRGVLSGQGKALYAIWMSANKELEKVGIQPAQEVIAEESWMLQQIKNAG